MAANCRNFEKYDLGRKGLFPNFALTDWAKITQSGLSLRLLV
jgi:hypothetical protein